MAAPPPKKPQPEGLAEVERALSVLQGRHPEHERARREDQERRTARQAEIEARATLESKRLLKRRLIVGAGVGVGLVVAVTLIVFFKAELARRARLEQAADPYRAMGFAVVETSSRKLDAPTEAGCLLAVTTTPSDVRLQMGEAVVEGASPLLTCTCEAGTVSASSSAEGIVILRAETAAIGGSRAFPFLPFAPRTAGATDSACAETSLDKWIEAKRYQTAETREHVRALVPPSGAPDARFPSFKQLSILKREAPFVVVEGPPNACVLLVPKASDRFAVRAKTLGWSFGNEPAGFCTPSATTFLVERQGDTGDIEVFVAPADLIGGTAGLRELNAKAVLVDADRGWDAKQLLVASAIPEAIISAATAPDIALDPEARIVALSLQAPRAIASDAPDGVYSFCDPPIDRAMHAVCAFSGPQRWHGPTGGIARAKLPFWLFGMQNVAEPAALKIETQLLALARRLRREGFEPTTMEALTETDKGAEVLGRANEDAIVVVGLAPTAPWAFPLSDGPAWTLDQSPRIVPIAPLARVQLTTGQKLPPKAARRTVVFRRKAP
jgi:hypothetical protein